MTTPLISVIIPLYNKETSILQTVNSVLLQSFKHFELLIINDGSTDRSLDVISSINDDRLKIISKANGGVSDARNFGVKQSLGDFIFFLDADDCITKDCLEIFINLVNKYKNISVFTANFKVVDGNSEIIYCKKADEAIIANPLKSIWGKKIFPRTGAMLIKKSCFENIGFFRTDITVYEDLDFNLRLLKKYNIVYSPKIILAYFKEHSYLSKEKFPLSKEWAYHIDLKGKPFFEKLICAENIYNSLKKRIKLSDNEASKYLWKKNKKFLFYFVVAIVYRKLLGINYKML